jgi:hypothetical protein
MTIFDDLDFSEFLHRLMEKGKIKECDPEEDWAKYVKEGKVSGENEMDEDTLCRILAMDYGIGWGAAPCEVSYYIRWANGDTLVENVESREGLEKLGELLKATKELTATIKNKNNEENQLDTTCFDSDQETTGVLS